MTSTPTYNSYRQAHDAQFEPDSKEADLDKYATLFSPSTPHASPLLTPTPMTTVTHRRQPSTASTASTASSDFGSFVSVSAQNDPLSASFEELGYDQQLPPPMLPTNTTAHHGFFDKFAKEATDATEMKRKNVLDELLLHEDDPMYFLKSSDLTTDSSDSSNSPLPSGSTDSPLLVELQSKNADSDTSHTNSPSKRRLSSPARAPSLPIPIPSPPTLAPPISSSPDINPRNNEPMNNNYFGINPDAPHDHEPQYHSHLNPKASNTSLNPTTGQGSHAAMTHISKPNRSTSYQSLTSLTGKWVSSLLRGSGGGEGSHPTAQSIFHDSGDGRYGIPVQRTNSISPSNQSASAHLRAASSPQTQTTSIHHPPSSQPQPIYFTHTTPFAAPLPSLNAPKSNPFAPHVYVPPSGAPGFRGDQYNWDKGFSNQLEEEWKGTIKGGAGMKKGAIATSTTTVTDTSQRTSQGSGAGRSRSKPDPQEDEHIIDLTPTAVALAARKKGQQRSSDTSSSSSSRSTSSVPKTKTRKEPGITSVGEFIERRSGGVELVGRKLSTTPVLQVGLARLIHPHLPALHRLANQWTLIYSLDQHGISLNTLYTLCDARNDPQKSRSTSNSGALSPSMIHSKACLLVVKDAEGAQFGAWLGEGLGKDRGRVGGRIGFFGSGESFLWSYKDRSREGEHYDPELLKVYRATGRNTYIAICETDYMGFGGGDGSYGLYLDQSLYDGSSAPSLTFGNEILCSPGPKKAGGSVEFECVGLEVWGMG